MNSVNLTGRLTKDIELRSTAGGVSVTSFSLAVKKRYKKADRDTDFIRVTAFRNSAEFLSSYAGKGDLIGVKGYIDTDSYEVDGEVRYTTEVVAEEVEILSKKNAVSLPEEINDDDDLPY